MIKEEVKKWLNFTGSSSIEMMGHAGSKIKDWKTLRNRVRMARSDDCRQRVLQSNFQCLSYVGYLEEHENGTVFIRSHVRWA